MPPQITWTLRSTKNTHKTRIALTTTTPCSKPIPKRVQNQETRLPPHIAHHIIIIQWRDQKEQRKGEEKESSYPRTKKDGERHRQNLRRHRKRVGQKNGGVLPKPKRTPRIRRRSPRKHQRRTIWILGSSWKFRTIDGG